MPSCFGDTRCRTFVLSGGTLTPARVFTTVSVFASVRMILGGFLPMGIQIANEVGVSIRRVEEILLLDHEFIAKAKREPPTPTSTTTRSGPALVLNKFWSGWPAENAVSEDKTKGSKRAAPAGNDAPLARARKSDLQDVELAVDFGELAVVMGPVGCGKTTLLLSILGEVKPERGSVLDTSQGSVLYSPQAAWVFPGTFRANICTFELDP